MKRMIIAIVIVAAVFLAAGASALRPGAAIIRLTAVELTNTNILLHKPGQTGTATYHLYNREIRPTSLGSAIVTCRFLGKGGILDGGIKQCQGTYILPRGSLVATGLVRRSLFYQLVVVGGTGNYANAYGTVIVQRLTPLPGDKNNIEQLLFQLRGSA